MSRSISRTEKRSRGRPRKSPTSIHLTLLPAQLTALDAWIADLSDNPSRPEAIRRLVEHSLAGRGTAYAARPPGKEAARKASKMAARELEPLGDKNLPPEEGAQRKRALIRGPKEFRDVRSDLPNKRSR